MADSASPASAPHFARLSRHFSGERPPMPAGCILLSQLPGGASAFTATAPSIKYVLQGEELYEVDGRRRKLCAGQFMLVEAGARIEVRIPANRDTIGLCVYLPEPAGSAADALLPAAISGDRFQPLAEMMQRHGLALLAGGVPGDPGKVIREVAGAADLFVSGFRDRLDRLGAAKASTRIELLQRVERARAFIHANADRPVELAEIVAIAAISRFHLVRCFASAFGLSPIAYHRALRLDQAAIRLARDLASPSQVAEQMGFPSPSAFSRAFRQHFGYPPSAARRRVSPAAAPAGRPAG